MRVFNLDQGLDLLLQVGFLKLVQLVLGHDVLVRLPLFLLVVGEEIVEVLIIIIVIEADQSSLPLRSHHAPHVLLLDYLAGGLGLLARREAHDVQLVAGWVLLVF